MPPPEELLVLEQLHAAEQSKTPLRSFEIDVHLRFRVDVRDIDQTSVLLFTQPWSNREEVRLSLETWKSMRRQRLMLHALIARPEALRAYAEYYGHWYFDYEVVDYFSSLAEEGEDYKLLSAGFDLLPEDERRHFEELYSEDLDYFLQDSQLVCRAMSMEKVSSGSSVREIPVEDSSSPSSA